MTKREMQKQIADLTERLIKLENMHARLRKADSWESLGFTPTTRQKFVFDGIEGSYYGRQLTARELMDRYHHPQPTQVDYRCLTHVPVSTAETDRISKVTLEELARLVIDGTPIRREEQVQSKRISEYTEDTTTRITITE